MYVYFAPEYALSISLKFQFYVHLLSHILSLSNCLTIPMPAVDCEGLENPTNGIVMLTGTTLGSVATYECNDGYIRVGKKRRRC